MSLERIKARVAQLLRVARDDAATEGEIANAIQAARNLMLAHHLEEADLQTADGSPQPAMGRTMAWTKFTNVAAWEKRLAHFVCRLIGGVGWYYAWQERLIDGRLKRVGTVTFYGIAAETELASEAYEELATTIFTMARAKYGGAYRSDGGTYAEGFVAGLMEQLRKANQCATSSGTELVARSTAIADAKLNRAKHWLTTECDIRIVYSSPSYGASGSHDAHAEGTEDGRRCDLSGVGAKRSRLASEPKLLN